MKGKSWFGKNDTVVFVQSTPGEVLKKGIEKIIAAKGFDVKVVEQGGSPYYNVLMLILACHVGLLTALFVKLRLAVIVT